MLPRKSSVATVDYPIHNMVLPRDFSVTRRHSAAPFSLARASTTDTKYSTLGISHHSSTPSSQEPRPIKSEDTGYERAFFVRMGQKLSAFLPKGAPAEHQESPVIRIKMRKEVHVTTEEAARDVRMGSSGNEGPLLHKPPHLWSPSEERIHGSHIHDSGVSLRPATAPGGSAERHSRRKPIPPSPMDIGYHTKTRIEPSHPSYSEPPQFQTLPPTRSYPVVPDVPIFPKSSQPNSDVSLRPTTAPGGSAERYSRRKPFPPSLMDTEYHTKTRIEPSYPSYSEQPRFQTLPPTRPYPAVPDGPLFPKRSEPNLGHENTPTNVVFAPNKTSTPVPPKRTQYMHHYQAPPSPNTISTAVVPIRPAQMRSLWTAWKSLFGGRAGKGKMRYSKKGAVLFARKASLKRKKGNTTHSPYQPYSTRAVAPRPVHTSRDSRRESPVVSRRFSVNHSRRLSRKQKSGLPSFLSIDSSDSLT